MSGTAGPAAGLLGAPRVHAPLFIRRAVPADAGAFARIFTDPAVYAGTMQMPYPVEERWRKVLDDQIQPGRADVPLVAERDGTVVGSAGLFPAGPSIRRRHAMTLGISVAADAQGTGVGTALMAALCDVADRWIGLLRIELTVYADNEVAQRLYRRFGFEVEGRFKAYALRDGQYVDALSMARLHPNPPLLPAR